MALQSDPLSIWLLAKRSDLLPRIETITDPLIGNDWFNQPVSTVAGLATEKTPDCIVLELDQSDYAKEMLTGLLVNLGRFKAHGTEMVFITNKRNFKPGIDCAGCHDAIVSRYDNFEIRFNMALNRIIRRKGRRSRQQLAKVGHADSL